MTGIGDVSYLVVPFIGIIFMQILLWALIYVAPRSSEDEDGRRSGTAVNSRSLSASGKCNFVNQLVPGTT